MLHDLDDPSRDGAPEASAPRRLRLEVRRLDPGLPLPVYAKAGDAGLDLRSREDLTIEPGHRALVPTGLAIAVPDGWVGLVHPRSGLAARHGVTVLNAPGTIDSGYRGEVVVVLLNTDRAEAFRVSRGDRIAQLVLQQVGRAELVECDQLSETERAGSGFGSSGRR